MKIIVGIIGMGIGQKHLEAIDNYKGAEVTIICEKDKKKIKKLQKRYPDKLITNDESHIFLDKEINLVSIASYDNYHYEQILKCIKFNKNLIVEKPLCLNGNNHQSLCSSPKSKNTDVLPLPHSLTSLLSSVEIFINNGLAFSLAPEFNALKN